MTSCGGQQQCSPVTLFLRYPDLLRVISSHALRATKSVILDSKASCTMSIKTGLSAPLVILSLCTQLNPVSSLESDPRELHNYVCRDLRHLAEALLLSPQMLLRQLAAKALVRLVHPADIEQELRNVIVELSGDELFSKGVAHDVDIADRNEGADAPTLNKYHGYLLKLEYLLLNHGRTCKMDTTITFRMLDHLQKLKEKNERISKCSCITEVLEKLIHQLTE